MPVMSDAVTACPACEVPYMSSMVRSTSSWSYLVADLLPAVTGWPYSTVAILFLLCWLSSSK